MDPTSVSRLQPAAAALHADRIKSMANDHPCGAGSPRTAYPCDRLAPAQLSADALVPVFTTPSKRGCDVCGVQLQPAGPHKFQWFTVAQGTELLRKHGKHVLVIGDSLGRRLMYEMAAMLYVPASVLRLVHACARSHVAVVLGSWVECCGCVQWPCALP